MANELRIRYQDTGATLYAHLGRSSDGFLFNGTGFEAPLAANWATYKRVMAEQSTTRYYYGNLPAGLPADLYDVYVYLQAGGSPAVTDEYKGQGRIDWNGAADVGVGAGVRVATFAADALDANALAASAVAEITAGLATAVDVTAVLAAVAAVGADTDNLQSRLPAALVGGRMNASVGDYPGNTPQSGDAYAGLFTTAWPEVGVPGVTATLKDRLVWVCSVTTNEVRQNDFNQIVRNAAGTGNLASANVSDDDVTTIRSRFS